MGDKRLGSSGTGLRNGLPILAQSRREPSEAATPVPSEKSEQYARFYIRCPSSAPLHRRLSAVFFR